ncbi:MAG: EmrA/EmrK family multidrug efflux transporter periplasmic adaptor subunit [Alphaproteobacteria bacterium]|nr:EmrA/EmrK family multidrug efflux transporter periplasmic adaptor subunit [Alphaproteobacteria bacterium]
MENELSATRTNTDQKPKRSKRKNLFGILALVVLLAVAGLAAWWFLVGSRRITTDNAYVAAEIAQVTASVSGIVKDVKVNDTQEVKRGDVLVVLDDSDAKLALAQAEAELGLAARKVRGFFANDESLSARVQAQEAEKIKATAQLRAAESNLKKAQLDRDRRQKLSKSGSVSGEELSNALNTYAAAQAILAGAQAGMSQAESNYNSAVASLKANTVLTEDATEDTNPEVALARARRDQAKTDLERTILYAPVDGIVAHRQVQLGQRIEKGAPLMAVVPLLDVHVDANFKEVQLEKVKPGQDVELESDLYGDKVKYHGKVAGFSGGTGAAFALIPAQNATGNWIKVVQRLPVRITLDPEELRQHPLQVGLSMEVTIDIAHDPK